jgi:ubiquinone/menaquinone biosynthesis C-methylase UbiE
MPPQNEVLQRYEGAVSKGDFASAVHVAEEMKEITESPHRDSLVRLARAHALAGRGQAALMALWEAVDAGFWDAVGLREDPAFTWLRGEEAFKAIVRASWARGYLAMLERDERESFQRTAEVMRTLAFRPGERVVDLGAGSGYFTIPIARAVGPGGIVWAVDVFQEMLDFIERRIAVERLDNIRLFQTSREELNLPDGNLDTILMSDMLHYVPDRVPLLRKLKPFLRPGGRMAVLEFTPKPMAERPWGPAPDQQVSRETIESEMRQAGMRFSAAYDFLPEQHFTIHVRDPE